ncbi:MAG: argininosuccinate lyase, partial [Acidimicrobiaceae bacterium]|nr:argininosuccinate lyase [Acidimicrobiaceae bacterium]
LAEDLEIWSSQEFDYVDLAGPFTRASVLMPQKRNPYSLSIIRGASGVLIGRMSGFLAVVKSPSARSDNLIFAYGEIPRALDFTIRVSALTTGVVKTLTVNAERMWSELERGFTQATDLAEYVMVAGGVDYRTAYNVVGQAVRAASGRGLRGLDITPEMLDDAAEAVCGRHLGLDPADLAEALDPRRIVATRRATGGASPGEVRSMAEEFSDHAARLRARAVEARKRHAQTEESLLAQARALVARG